ncbi:hypothetical protein MACH10_06850 [Thalassospira tepidiphila]|uniref:hypothetical protein n=1 Tax=Thalassospira tepidiphila TaxID=393657 RepID=UPI0029206D2E|nr:hypothetical protein MACH10_06850 [Thalassospira tepidiphila]
MFSISDAHMITDPVLRDQIEQHPRAQDLLRAFLYPYPAPDHDFLFRGGEVVAMEPSGVATETKGRTPVLAVGSNRAPVQLARKFTHQNLSDEIPVTHGWLAHHDIVYSTHITGYGAVPATLAPSPGTRVRVSVTWLTPIQLAHMHVKESVPAHYSYQQLHGGDLDLDCGVRSDHVGMYQSVRGHVFDQGSVFTLSAIEARDRRFTSLDQWEMLALFAKRAGQVFSPAFVLRVIDDPAFRRLVVEQD